MTFLVKSFKVQIEMIIFTLSLILIVLFITGVHIFD